MVRLSSSVQLAPVALSLADLIEQMAGLMTIAQRPAQRQRLVAQLECAVNHGDRLGLGACDVVPLDVELRHPHAPEPQRGDLEPLTAQPPFLHLRHRLRHRSLPCGDVFLE